MKLLIPRLKHRQLHRFCTALRLIDEGYAQAIILALEDMPGDIKDIEIKTSEAERIHHMLLEQGIESTVEEDPVLRKK